MENKIQKTNKKDSQLINLESQLDLLLKGQEKNSDKLQIIGEELRRGFIGLALRNEELLKSNEQLKQQLDDVIKELNQIKQERREKEIRKQTRANRKRLPQRDPMTAEIYKELIKEAEGPTYLHVRLRLALCLLAVTGVRINELLNIIRTRSRLLISTQAHAHVANACTCGPEHRNRCSFFSRKHRNRHPPRNREDDR